MNPKNYIKYYCWLALLIILIYWPVSTFLFALKNDAIAGYFPAKYFIAESIRNKIIPWWNPYINYGYPMHADLTGTFWSPITWFFSFFMGYSVYTVHLEFLLYLIMAAIGMFRLCIFFKQIPVAAFIIALCYGCSGIFTGNAQHTNWICAAALIPFLLQALITVINHPEIKKAIYFSLWCSLFIVTAHPYFIICLLFSFFILGSFIAAKSTAAFGKISAHLLVSFLIIILLTSGFLYSVIELMPFITRGESLTVSQTGNAFQPASTLSFFLPFSTVSQTNYFGDTDLSMRNGYIGLTGIIFIITSLLNQKNFYQKLFLSAGAIFFILSFGGIITGFVTKYIPLLGYIRLISVFRVPGIFFFLLAASFTLDQFLTGKIKVKLDYALWFVFILIAVIAFYASIKLIVSQTSSFFPSSLERIDIKKWAESLTFEKACLIQAIIQLVLLGLLTLGKRKNFSKILIIVCVADLFIATSLNAPYTIVGKKSVSEIQQILNEAPQGFPLPQLKAIEKNLQPSTSVEKIFGNWSMYNKEPGTITKAKTYPSLFKSNNEYFNSGLNKIYIKTPFAYLAGSIKIYTGSIAASVNDSATCFINQKFLPQNLNLNLSYDSSSVLKITDAKPNHFSFDTYSSAKTILVLKQNAYKYWKAYEDGKEMEIIPCNYTFMAVPVNKGRHEINFSYKPGLPKTLGMINIITLLLVFIYLLTSSLYTKKG